MLTLKILASGYSCERGSKFLTGSEAVNCAQGQGAKSSTWGSKEPRFGVLCTPINQHAPGLATRRHDRNSKQPLCGFFFLNKRRKFQTATFLGVSSVNSDPLVFPQRHQYNKLHISNELKLLKKIVFQGSHFSLAVYWAWVSGFWTIIQSSVYLSEGRTYTHVKVTWILSPFIKTDICLSVKKYVTSSYRTGAVCIC